MCLILFAYNTHPLYPLIVAANRDEFHARPTAPAHFWESSPQLLAGRDLQSGGTWVGITQQGRFAAVTNYREPQQTPINPKFSRGALVSNYLHSQQSTPTYLQICQQQSADYQGFNLIAGNIQQDLYYYSNRQTSPQKLMAGIYGLSNQFLDTPWVKVQKGKAHLQSLMHHDFQLTELLALLSDKTLAEDAQLPQTGVSLAWERLLSPLFITSPDYGTRSSTVLRVNTNGAVEFCEQRFNPMGDIDGTTTYRFTLTR
ncbi:NRDE family protein [Beggiatoa leptomitoformis]|uniref:NRDE family protein n=1 Tax=Beggiatoa leptomitoformis TaxID=288004 RepID=A0A2N9YDM7_9GAMM|nr:NRDE family protein [Beggiatoa leptomitoformis]AUI68587.1 hypothetical protein BLE401_07630 [Beggiatoa leptomitoformis]QGX03830.1 hypothetical protein AL038_16610 [Beggiatoa leptomitoformis]